MPANRQLDRLVTLIIAPLQFLRETAGRYEAISTPQEPTRVMAWAANIEDEAVNIIPSSNPTFNAEVVEVRRVYLLASRTDWSLGEVVQVSGGRYYAPTKLMDDGHEWTVQAVRQNFDNQGREDKRFQRWEVARTYSRFEVS